MMKVLFLPLSVIGGLLGGLLGKKLFEQLWALFDEEEPPGREHRDVTWKKALAALTLQGAAFGLARGLTDRGARMAFFNATGKWPGEKKPERA